MRIYIGSMIVALVLFVIVYYAYLSLKNSRNKNLIVDKAFLRALFVSSKNARIAVQGLNDEIDVRDVAFLEEDFKSEVKKINWAAVENQLSNIE